MVLRLHFLDYGKDLNVPTESEIPEEDIEEEMPSLQNKNSSSRPSEESHPGLDHLFMTRETSTLTDITFEDVDADMWEHVAQDRTGINLEPSTSNVNADESAEKDDQEEEGGHEDQETTKRKKRRNRKKKFQNKAREKKKRKARKHRSTQRRESTMNRKSETQLRKTNAKNETKGGVQPKRRCRATKSTTLQSIALFATSHRHNLADISSKCTAKGINISLYVGSSYWSLWPNIEEQSRGTRRLGGQGETTKVYRGRPRESVPSVTEWNPQPTRSTTTLKIPQQTRRTRKKLEKPVVHAVHH